MCVSRHSSDSPLSLLTVRCGRGEESNREAQKRDMEAERRIRGPTLVLGSEAGSAAVNMGGREP